MTVSDQKTERLLNLTMALLATTRFMSKSEIFKSVAGYTGSTETKERMFERDKDDLREIGIVIDVGSFDPLFDDEIGYRIKNAEYALDLGKLNASERSYLSLAAKLWRNQLFHSSGARALLKVAATDGSAFMDDFAGGVITLENETPHFESLWQAIADHSAIQFTYSNPDISRRNVNPYGLSLWHGIWYLVGHDLDKEGIRVFRLSRIIEEIVVANQKNSFTIPENFSLKDHLIMLNDQEMTTCIALIRVGRCNSLRVVGSVISVDAEWDRITFRQRAGHISDLLWFGDNLILESPVELRNQLMSLLAKK